MASWIEQITYKVFSAVNNPTGNPSANGYKVIHGSISDSSLNDAQDTTDTTVDSNKTYYTSVDKTAEKRSSSSSRSTDDTGQRGGGAAQTGEAEASCWRRRWIILSTTISRTHSKRL